MLKVVVIEDEPHAMRRLSGTLRKIDDVSIVGTAGDGARGLALIERLKPDIAFLDISLPGKTGMEVAASLTAPDAPLVIFVTAYDRFALDAFGVAAVDYVLKPVELDRLVEALERARRRLDAERAGTQVARLEGLLQAMGGRAAEPQAFETEIWVSSRGRTSRLPAAEIHWLEAARDYVRVHTQDREHLLREPFQGLLGRLDPTLFLRVHRSAAVGLKHVEKIERQGAGALSIVVAGGQRVPVARRYAPAVRRLITGRGVAREDDVSAA